MGRNLPCLRTTIRQSGLLSESPLLAMPSISRSGASGDRDGRTRRTRRTRRKSQRFETKFTAAAAAAAPSPTEIEERKGTNEERANALNRKGLPKQHRMMDGRKAFVQIESYASFQIIRSIASVTFPVSVASDQLLGLHRKQQQQQ